MKIEDGPAAVIGNVLFIEPLTSCILCEYLLFCREGEEGRKVRESEDLPDVKMIAVEEYRPSTDSVDTKGNPRSDNRPGIFLFQVITQDSLRRFTMVVREKSVTKMVLWQVKDWDSFQLVMRYLL